MARAEGMQASECMQASERMQELQEGRRDDCNHCILESLDVPHWKALSWVKPGLDAPQCVSIVCVCPSALNRTGLSSPHGHLKVPVL